MNPRRESDSLVVDTQRQDPLLWKRVLATGLGAGALAFGLGLCADAPGAALFLGFAGILALGFGQGAAGTVDRAREQTLAGALRTAALASVRLDHHAETPRPPRALADAG